MIQKIHTTLERVLTPQRRETLQDVGLLLLRLSVGLGMLLAHGWGKLMAFGEKADSFPDPLGVGSSLSMALAIGAEVFGSLLLALGLGTRLALIPLITTMLVAFFIVHGGDPWARRELAFLYLTAYSCLLLMGPGRLSLDALILKRVQAQTPAPE